jgi:hypothetical protein
MRARRAPSIVSIVVCSLLAACGGGASNAPAAGGGAPGGGQAPAVSPADERLAAEVTRFLDAFVAKRQPGAAITGRATALFGDQRFVPPSTLSDTEYRALASQATADAAVPITPKEFEAALQEQLASALADPDAPDGPQAAPVTPPSLASLLQPFSSEVARQTDPDVWSAVGPHNPRPLLVAGVPSLAYQVRDWPDIEWTASGNVGFKFALASVIQQRNVNVQAVVTRLKATGSATRDPLIVTLWSDEGRGGAEWRYIGFEPVPIQ